MDLRLARLGPAAGVDLVASRLEERHAFGERGRDFLSRDKRRRRGCSRPRRGRLAQDVAALCAAGVSAPGYNCRRLRRG